VTPAMGRDAQVTRYAGYYRRLAHGVAAVTAIGLFKPFTRWGDTIGLEGKARAHKRWAFADAGHNRASADEIAHWETAVGQALAAGPLDPAWPVAVVTAGVVRGASRLKDLQAAPAEAATHGHIDYVPRANHASLLGLAFADPILAAIEQVLKASRAK